MEYRYRYHILVFLSLEPVISNNEDEVVGVGVDPSASSSRVKFEQRGGALGR